MKLFTPFLLKNIEVKNRVVLPPMCMYAVDKKDGIATDFHFVHYGAFAKGGFGLLIQESTAVEPEGRISDNDLGLWNQEQAVANKKIIDFCHSFGTKMAIQLGHAGRKAADAKVPLAPSPIAYPGYRTPKEMTLKDIDAAVNQFAKAAQRAVDIGFDAIEIHGAHGYLIHQFHSPQTNHRKDEYGENLSLFGVQVIKAVRKVIPQEMPLIIRLSAVEFSEGGYGLDHSINLAKDYVKAGVDILHISSGGENPLPEGIYLNYDGYQLGYAKRFKEEFDNPIIAVGRVNSPEMAEYAIAGNMADLVAIGRDALRDPHWCFNAARKMGEKIEIPFSYKRAYK